MALNQVLYDALLAAAKSGRLGRSRRVTVRNEGKENVMLYAQHPLATEEQKQYGKHLKAEIASHGEGETYWVCCPFCNDSRYRLSINYMWGVKDPQLGGRRHRFMINCFNEHCQNRPTFHQDLESKLTSYAFAGGNIHLASGEPVSDGTPRPIEPPGPCVRLDELPPTHHSHRLLRSQGHDPYLLARYWGVSYCISSNMRFANGRIIFPVYVEQELKGWQARYVDEDGGGDVKGLWFCKGCLQFTRLTDPNAFPGKVWVNPKSGKLHFDDCPLCGHDEIDEVPKYWTCPGMIKSDLLYNYSNARKWPFVVVTEGPRDPISLGTPFQKDVPGPATCLFGHKISSMQKKLLVEGWWQGACVVLLDPDAYEVQKDLIPQLRTNFNKGVCGVLLPEGRDPGETEHNLAWQMITETCKKEGVDLGL